MNSLVVPGALIGLAFGIGVVLTALAAVDRGRPADRRRSALHRLIDESGVVGLTPARLISASVGLAAISGIGALLVFAVPAAALIVAIAAGALPVGLLRRRARRRTRLLRLAWPDAVDTLSAGVRAGLSLPEAVADLARQGPEPLRTAFAEFARDHRSHGSFDRALDALQRECSDAVADRVVAALRVARDVGGADLGTVLRSLSAMLREDSRARGEIEARQSWTVSAARLAVAAPWVTLALLSTRPDAARSYATTAGAVLLVCCAVLSLVAYQLMTRIARLPGDPRLAVPR